MSAGLRLLDEVSWRGTALTGGRTHGLLTGSSVLDLAHQQPVHADRLSGHRHTYREGDVAPDGSFAFVIYRMG